MIQLNDEYYWLYAAVDPETNELLHTSALNVSVGC
jgi:transposase-like protein